MSKCVFVFPRLMALLLMLLQISVSSADEATLSIWQRDITTFRVNIAGVTAQERVDYALSRIESTPPIELHKGPRSVYKTQDDEASVGFYFGDHFIFYLREGDLAPGQTLKEEEEKILTKLTAYAEAQARQREPRRILIGIVAFLVFTVIFFLCMFILAVYRRWIERLFSKEKIVDKKIVILGVDFSSHIAEMIKRGLLTLSWVCLAVLSYIYVVLLLRAFPYTEVWGQKLGRKVIGLIGDLLLGVLRSIPDLFTLMVIYVIIRSLINLVKYTFEGMEGSKRRGRWMDEDTRKATKRVLIILIWVFGVVVAYPYIPGSDSEAFKGISVLLGLMVSLGSTGLVNQIMAGFVVLYSGAMRSGEYVHMGDVEGTLTEVGLLSCKVLTPRGEYVSIPNAVIMNGKTVNYSRLAKKDGAVFATSITIGYDTPWKTVHRLMQDAASNTTQIKDSPKPRIIQEELGDFAVKYTLVFNVDDPQRKPAILTEVHTKIQDGFAREGIQIMSPHFNMQPEDPVLPPRD
ncbi:hypothetical protein Rhal01_00352 [Rubritalea halochordaticola]|uniref:Mechanosensitive ion channel n=1 Tax=Rubritalea halochordaticola TaxID=714537 RepID=A0ABP9UXX7_9BACT